MTPESNFQLSTLSRASDVCFQKLPLRGCLVSPSDIFSPSYNLLLIQPSWFCSMNKIISATRYKCFRVVFKSSQSLGTCLQSLFLPFVKTNKIHSILSNLLTTEQFKPSLILFWIIEIISINLGIYTSSFQKSMFIGLIMFLTKL